MKVPIKVDNSFAQAEIVYVTRREFAFLDQWRTCLAGDKHPLRADAVDFAALACKRFAAHSSIENYARCVEDITVHISNNPYSEVANLVLMRCDWFPEAEVIGL